MTAASTLAGFLGRALARGRSLLGLRSAAEAAAAARRFDAMMRSREEHAEWLAEARARNAQLRRAQVHRYAREHMLPRIDLGGESGGEGAGGGGAPGGGTSGGVRLRPLAASEAGGLSPANRHVVAAFAAFGPLVAFVLYATWRTSDHQAPAPATPPALTREAAPSSAAGPVRLQAQAPPPATAPAPEAPAPPPPR